MKKCLKNKKSSYLAIAIFSKKHLNSNETEMRDSSTWDSDWRALYVATIWEQSMLCLVHSTRCRPGLTQTDIPLQQLRCTSGQGAGPRFGWNKPIYLYSRCYKNCLCRVMWLAGSLTSEKYISKPCWLVHRIKQMTALIQNRSIYSVLSCDYCMFCHVTIMFYHVTIVCFIMWLLYVLSCDYHMIFHVTISNLF